MAKKKTEREKLLHTPKYIGMKIEMETYLKLKSEAAKAQVGISHLVRNILNNYGEKII